MSRRLVLLLVTALYLKQLTSIGYGLKISIFAALWLSTGGRRWLYLFRNTYKRDLRLLYRGVRVLLGMAYVKYGDRNVVFMFRRVVQRLPDKVIFINDTDGRAWTFTEIEKYSNQVANYFLKEGYQKGDTVALLMNNRPEYVAIWIGLAKIGVIPALINYNLRGEALLHTIMVADSKAMIYGLELEEAVTDIYKKLKASSDKDKFTLYHSKSGANLPSAARSTFKVAYDLDEGLERSSDVPEPDIIRNSIHVTDPLLYIYTSGTTGLPKAVIINHMRQLLTCLVTRHLIGMTKDDILYCYLPLYHSSGGQMGMASSLFIGATSIVKQKFSATSFWKDCVKYNVTGTQYIGEICRYLLATSPVAEEKQHKIRIMFGNGLRPQIWERFIKRFNVPNIAEFYGATEGTSNTINIENQVGCVGSIGVCFPEFIVTKLFPLYIIKVDAVSGEPVRSKDGFCLNTDTGEPGEFIGRIIRGDPLKDFVGYRDPEATKKKILQDVFQKGDIYFRSGDILVRDEFGWLHFKDRIGDTFRWKGENVSTQEVEAIISNILELKDTTSYGVEVPDTEGRAGMLAIPITDEDDVDLVKLYKGVHETLPAHARPILVRLVKELHMTGTYKMRKNMLQEEGFDITKIKDPMFFLDTKAGKYVKLTKKLFKDMTSGMLRL